MPPAFISSFWRPVGMACLLAGCTVAPVAPPMQTSVFGPGGFASTASPPVPYVNQGPNTPLQTLNSLPPSAATGLSGPF